MLVESPLHIVQEEAKSSGFKRVQDLCTAHPDDFDFEPLWYWCALRSLTSDQVEGLDCDEWPTASREVQDKLLLLHHQAEPLESNPMASAERLAKELVPGATASLIEKLTQVWVLNAFEYSDRPSGVCTYFFSSFMSHSCEPNAFWYYDGDNHALRARADIAIGDEVCISYLNEGWLLRAAPERRWSLNETKHFWCACTRCDCKQDVSRGFCCPACRAGTIFAPAPVSGPAESASPPAGDLMAATCSACATAPTPVEAAELECHEKAMEGLVRSFARESTLATAERLEELVSTIFTQHWQADLARAQLIRFYTSQKRPSETLRHLRLRSAFAAAAYPGFSGAHSSCLETLADAICHRTASGRKELAEAAGAYEEASGIVACLYGEDNSRTDSLSNKLRLVRQRLSKSDV